MHSPQKKDDVPEMFNNISGSYDFLNHFLSFGIDKYWRKRMLKMLKASKHNIIADLACGTGDVSKALLSLNPEKIYAIDPASKMLDIAAEKLNYTNKIEYIVASAEELPLENDSIDLLTVAFGVRNFTDLQQGMSEIYRVLNKGGQCAILEFSMPKNILVKPFYLVYLNVIVPIFGRLFSRNKQAYRYLMTTIREFSANVNVQDTLLEVGFKSVREKPFSLGIVRCYIGEK